MLHHLLAQFQDFEKFRTLPHFSRLKTLRELHTVSPRGIPQIESIDEEKEREPSNNYAAIKSDRSSEENVEYFRYDSFDRHNMFVNSRGISTFSALKSTVIEVMIVPLLHNL